MELEEFISWVADQWHDDDGRDEIADSELGYFLYHLREAWDLLPTTTQRVVKEAFAHVYDPANVMGGE